jgi:hypothetical protein
MYAAVDASGGTEDRVDMRLDPSCPRCADPVHGSETSWRCPTHGATLPLWRVEEPDYDAFAEYLVLSRPLPSWLPWPLPPGWQVSEFGCVAVEGRPPRAAFVTCTGATELDGVVELTVVTEEPGVGLGARIGGVDQTDPGREVGVGPPAARVRVDTAGVPVWPVSTSGGKEALDRSVLAGEALGRWLWLVLRPASAALLLPDLGQLHDVSELGPELVTLPFVSVPRSW